MSTVAALETFNHATHFVSEALEAQAISTFEEFKATLRRTFKELVAIGQKLLDLRDRFFDELGLVEGKKAFDDWLESDFGGSRYLAIGSMQLASWYYELPKKLQRVVRHNAAAWNLSCLQKLTKIATPDLEAFLDRVEQLMEAGKKITAASLKEIATSTESKGYLVLGQLATDADWRLVEDTYELEPEPLNLLKLEAQQNAWVNPETGALEVKTDDIIAALNTFDYDPSWVLPKPKTRRFSEKEVQLTVQEAVEAAVTQAIAEIEREREQLSEQVAMKERILMEKEAENAQLRHKIRELEKAHKTEIPLTANLNIDSLINSPSLLIHKPLFEGAPVKVTSGESVGATGKIVRSQDFGSWWVRLDRLKNLASEALTIFRSEELELCTSQPQLRDSGLEAAIDNKVSPLNPVFDETTKSRIQELDAQMFLNNPKGYIAANNPARRKRVRGFA